MKEEREKIIQEIIADKIVHDLTRPSLFAEIIKKLPPKKVNIFKRIYLRIYYCFYSWRHK